MPIFLPRRRPSPSPPVLRLRCLASDTGHKLRMSIAGSSSIRRLNRVAVVVAPAVPQSSGFARDGTGARTPDPRGMCVDRQQRTRCPSALPTGDPCRLRKSDVKSDVAHARRRRQTAAHGKENSCTDRICERYSCSGTPGKDRINAVLLGKNLKMGNHPAQNPSPRNGPGVAGR